MFTSRVTNATTSRERIQAVAEKLFERDGFAATGVREIAAEAGVAPALVIRYFGSKEGLFLTTVRMDNSLTAAVVGPLDTLGVDLARHILTLAARDSAAGGVFAALMRASDRPAVRESLRASTETTVLGPLRDRLSGADADLRARLILSCILGLQTLIGLIGDESLPGADPEGLVREYGAAIQLLVDGS